jgi:hypothetical protein
MSKQIAQSQCQQANSLEPKDSTEVVKRFVDTEPERLDQRVTSFDCTWIQSLGHSVRVRAANGRAYVATTKPSLASTSDYSARGSSSAQLS